ncbi:MULTISPECIES: Uma2 family endonuclease [unclassified Streptomyces]|uniref:Uma2 family endonuclease n=1 Tax=unclassified Streptomyces TaxID=2593676 RepID=UPI00278C686E|nr:MULTISPECIES: Uma2 family endonuclease [unclassified Streptomyces]
MSPGTADRPQMSIENFEELNRRAPESLRNKLEFWDGRLLVKHGPIDVEDFEELARVAPETVTLELLNGKLEDGVLMVVEVASKDRDTHRRDRQEKPHAYAYADIPVYLVVARDNGTVVVHSSPENGVYQNRRPHHYGATIRIRLKDYA